MLRSPAVEISGLVKRYDGRTVVDALDLVAERGAVTAVLGPNGAGKTTTVECCEGLRVPDDGRVRVLGLDPVADGAAPAAPGRRHAPGRRPADRRPRAGGAPHVAAMYAHPRDVGELAERLGLGSFARTTVRRLSGGQRQRLALAAAVVGRPELVFLDEPSAGMDPQARHAVWDLVRELRDEGVAVVLTTHLMDEAEDLADQVVVVDHGRVIAQGSGAVARAPRPRTATLRLETGAGPRPARRARRGTSSSPSRATGRTPSRAPSTPDAVAAVTAWLATNGALATRLTVGRRTLEDVFLDLTGRNLR